MQTFVTYSAVEEDCLSVYGPRGKLRVDRYRGLDVEYTSPYARSSRLLRLGQAVGAASRLPYLWQKARAPGNEPSYSTALTHFVAAVRSGQPAAPDLHDGYRSLAVIQAAEENLFRDLRARGHRLYLEPSAQVRHVNISAPASFLRAEYLSGRMFGATRSRLENWSRTRKLHHAIGGPLFALARLWHVLRDIVRTGHQREVLPRALPALVAGLLLHGTGEAVGIAFGAGQAHRQRSTHELHRLRHVHAHDWDPEAAE